MVSQNILHILGPNRWDAVAAIVGDRAALEQLRLAVNEALITGSGCMFLTASDGEPYLLAIALQPDMQAVHTTYADEPAPVRSLREQIPLRQVANFRAACAKAVGLSLSDDFMLSQRVSGPDGAQRPNSANVFQAGSLENCQH